MSKLNAQLSAHFSWREVIRSPVAFTRGIDNTPLLEHYSAIVRTAKGMERIRHALGDKSVLVFSWYRCPDLNRMVGGSKGSQHQRGEAVDFACPDFGPPKLVAQVLEVLVDKLWIDQLILEGSWVHVSFSETPRGQVLTARIDDAGKRVYLLGIV